MYRARPQATYALAHSVMLGVVVATIATLVARHAGVGWLLTVAGTALGVGGIAAFLLLRSANRSPREVQVHPDLLRILTRKLGALEIPWSRLRRAELLTEGTRWLFVNEHNEAIELLDDGFTEAQFEELSRHISEALRQHSVAVLSDPSSAPASHERPSQDTGEEKFRILRAFDDAVTALVADDPKGARAALLGPDKPQREFAKEEYRLRIRDALLRIADGMEAGSWRTQFVSAYDAIYLLSTLKDGALVRHLSHRMIRSGNSIMAGVLLSEGSLDAAGKRRGADLLQPAVASGQMRYDDELEAYDVADVVCPVACDHYEQLRQQEPNNPLVLKRAGYWFLLAGRHQDAVECGRHLQDLQPTAADGVSLQAEALIRSEQWDEAAAVLRKGLSVFPEEKALLELFDTLEEERALLTG